MQNKPITTSHGKYSSHDSAKPAEMYCTPHVLSPLLKIKLRTVSMIMGVSILYLLVKRPFVKKKPT